MVTALIAFPAAQASSALAASTPAPSMTAVGGAPTANLLPNGSAESGAYLPTASPTGWLRTGSADLSWAKPQAHGGRHSLGITAGSPTDSAWTQTLQVAPNQLYRLTGWVKTAAVAHSAEPVDAGASLSVKGTWDHTVAVVGTQ